MGSEDVVTGQNGETQPGVETVGALGAAPVPAPEPTAPPQAKGRRRDQEAQSVNLEGIKPGMQFKGRVRNVVEFGAFVDIGVGRDGLLHVSILKQVGLDKAVKVGDTLDVVIRRIDPEENRISLSLPRADEEAEPKTSLRDLQAGAVVSGRVVRLAEFGAFVDIGAQTDGLVHVSQLPGGYVNKPGDVVQVGDEVQVRILEVDSRRRRISLSMREAPAEERSEERAKPAEVEEPMPTAFEAAFEKARSELRRRQRRGTS